MSTDAQTPEDVPDAAESRGAQDVVFNLDFVPTWARKPAANPYAGSERREERVPSGRSSWDRGGSRGGAGGSGSRGGGGGSSGGGRGARPHGDRKGPPRSRHEPGGRSAPSRPPERLPLEVQFIPERRQLSALVRQIHAAQKTFPLSYVAGLLLAKPEFHQLKIELRPGRAGAADVRLVQCAEDGALFPDLESLRAHAIAKHLDQYFEVQDLQVDAPTGNFNCVGRCRLSGELLGPPNYHGYNERVVDLHRTRFQHLSLDEYRGHIEIVRDPALIEQWKDGCRTQRVYRPKGLPDAAPLKRDEAVTLFLQKHFPKMQRTGTRFIVPAETVRDMRPGVLRGALEEAWMRENRFPLSLMLALRPAFKRMHLHLYKAGRGETFVTAIAPRALDVQHAVEPIRAMLELIRQHPGWNRQKLIQHLSPGTTLESEAGVQLLSPLRWLIEKGHVVEFFNGTLSAPAQEKGSTPQPATASTDTVADVPQPSSPPSAEALAAPSTETTPDSALPLEPA